MDQRQCDLRVMVDELTVWIGNSPSARPTRHDVLVAVARRACETAAAGRPPWLSA